MSGRIEWVLLAVLVPFVGGRDRRHRALRPAALLTTAVGATQIEISDHPLLPGSELRRAARPGWIGNFRSIALTLEVEEMASFRQGTDTRTERSIVWREPVKEWTNMQITPGVRFETQSRSRSRPARCTRSRPHTTPSAGGSSSRPARTLAGIRACVSVVVYPATLRDRGRRWPDPRRRGASMTVADESNGAPRPTARSACSSTIRCGSIPPHTTCRALRGRRSRPRLGPSHGASVLWYTEGKGEEDLGIHHFERLDDAKHVAEA